MSGVNPAFDLTRRVGIILLSRSPSKAHQWVPPSGAPLHVLRSTYNTLTKEQKIFPRSRRSAQQSISSSIDLNSKQPQPPAAHAARVEMPRISERNVWLTCPVLFTQIHLCYFFFFFFFSLCKAKARFFLLVPDWSSPDPAVGHLQVYAFLVQQIKPLCPFQGPDWLQATFLTSQFGDEWEKNGLTQKITRVTQNGE